MKLTLPYPPSANAYWRFNRQRGYMHPTHAAKKYKDEMESIVRAQIGPRARLPMYSGPVSVSVVVYRPARRGDLDNTLKVMLDALRGIAFVDDDQVVRITADREDDAGRPRAEVVVQPRQLAGQQTALELAEPEPHPEPPRGAVVTERPVLTMRELAAKAKSAVVSFRSQPAVPTEE